MSSISVPEVPDIAAASSAQPPPARRGFGNVRSLVISMVVILVAVLAWVAMVPRVREISQPVVDVTSMARQVRRDTGWTISQPALPAGWRATSVRFAAAAGGQRTWHVGYLSPEGNYVSIDQTDATGATDDWVLARTAHGRAEGTVSVAGTAWLKFSSREIVQRSLVSTGAGTVDLVTVLSGTAPYPQLVRFAEALRPVAQS